MFWVLIGGAVFLILLCGTLYGLAYLSAKHIRERDAQGLPQGLYQVERDKVVADPNNEILDEDAGGLRLRYRQRNTGMEFILRFDLATNKMHITPVVPEGGFSKAPEK